MSYLGDQPPHMTGPTFLRQACALDKEDPLAMGETTHAESTIKCSEAAAAALPIAAAAIAALSSSLSKCRRSFSRERTKDPDPKSSLKLAPQRNPIMPLLVQAKSRHGAARSTEGKLDVIKERSEELIQDSIKIHDSLISVEFQIWNLADAS
ncbi:hypothetical protein KSP40_PGU005692 [Platanthera guangdongensis]|uniref:Uncharacterized protein n=1 Tax=Platanthera guangdongensis TaxID=2320717 RepID=A0ABR2MQ70_9ASPA